MDVCRRDTKFTLALRAHTCHDIAKVCDAIAKSVSPNQS